MIGASLCGRGRAGTQRCAARVASLPGVHVEEPDAAFCRLPVACVALPVVRCMLHAAGCALHAACCTPYVACCTPYVACCTPYVACCTPYVAGRAPGGHVEEPDHRLVVLAVLADEHARAARLEREQQLPADLARHVVPAAKAPRDEDEDDSMNCAFSATRCIVPTPAAARSGRPYPHPRAVTARPYPRL